MTLASSSWKKASASLRAWLAILNS